MAVYDLEEQEQIAQLKAWWEQYGNLVVTVILVLALGFAGWQGWARYRNAKADEASAMYLTLQQAVAGKDADKARMIADELTSKHGGTVQAQLGTLLSANMQFQKNDLDSAHTQLEWAADKGKDVFLRDLARLRLAAVLMQQGLYSDVLARLQPVPAGSLRPRFEDLRGDAFAALGKAADARTAWQAALDALADVPETARMRDPIRIKLESLEG
jgi:predicted negative regulator of RcsB-dependent stress response